MKRPCAVRVDSRSGDTHFVLLESQPSEKRNDVQDFDEVEMKKLSKEEAMKPLILVRNE
jgi:hypothetical protein